jgi:hypothetical protein
MPKPSKFIMNFRFHVLFAAILLTAKLVSAEKNDLSIENESLIVKWSATTHRVSVISKFSGRDFLSDSILDSTNSSATVTGVNDKTFGEGRAIEVTSSQEAKRDVIMLFPKLPFALFQSSLFKYKTEIQETNHVHSVNPFSGKVNLGKAVRQLKTLGTGGLLAPEKNPGSYAWLAVVEPQSRNGVVFGWLTSERGSGILFSKVENDSVRVDGRIDYGNLQIPAGVTTLETLAIGYFDDARLGLESWADAVAKIDDIHLPPQPTVYCTWYSQPYGGASDEKNFAENAAFAATNLAPFGFSFAQIDDHWQMGVSTNGPKRGFYAHDPQGPYPQGMKATADKTKSLGLKPGIWFMPFAGTFYDPFFTNHPDWFAKTKDGKPYETIWGGTCFDLTNPDTRDYISNVVHRITHDWGFEYIKIDGLWTGTATPLRYVNTGYVEDNMGDAVFQNPNVSNIEAYRSGLKLVRAAAGTNVFILGCNGPQNMRSYGAAMGLVDGMRIGPDNGATWERMLTGPTFGSRHYFLNGRVWYNDPDPLYVRDKVPLNEAQALCSWVVISGAMNTSSEWYPGLTPARLDLLKRTMPSHGLLTARPVDLFENDLPRIWLLSDTTHTPRRDVIGVFNWSDNEEQFDYPLEKIGLDANTDYIAFDYWQNKLLPVFKGNLKISVPARSCCILAMRPVANHPQLISTSRHVTQGIVDVLDEKWDDATKTLSGRSKIIGGDDYELRIVGSKTSSKVEVSPEDTAASVKIICSQDDQLLRIKIQSPNNRDVSWSVHFK